MRTTVFLLAVALASLLTSCQSTGGNPAISQHSREPRGATGAAGTAGTAGAASEVTTSSPFRPVRPLISARYVPPDRYYGFGGGYRPVRIASSGAGSADDLNFLYDSDRRCWRRRYWGGASCLTGGGRYGSYRGGYASNHCSTGYGHIGGYYHSHHGR